MPRTLYLDLETYSEVPINNGTYAYAEAAEVMLLAWAIDSDPVDVCDLASGEALPAELEAAIADPDVLVCAHNSFFDRTVIRHALGIDIPIARWRDTMVKALAHSLPGALGLLGEIVGLPVDKAKDKAGRQLVLLFCKPRPPSAKIRRATRKTHPAEWARFIEYARLDIEAMRALDCKLPSWNFVGDELALWHLDQQINDRGMLVDLDLAKAAIAAVKEAQQGFAERTQELTLGLVNSSTQRDVLLRHLLEAHGVALPDLQQSTIERRINDPDLPAELRELLAIRLQASTTSTSKYQSLMRGVSRDGRLRGTLQFNGASRTGRWAGRLFQPQNLPRQSMLPERIDVGIEALKAGCADIVFGDVMTLTSNAIRGCIVAPRGKKLVAADLSNIEGRMLAWLAGEQWKLAAFREFDEGAGPDLYKLAYAKSFSIDPDDVTKDERQVGKVQELALGYEGGVGAFVTFAAVYGIDLDAMAENAVDVIDTAILNEARSALAWAKLQKRPRFGLSDRTWLVCDSFKRAWRNAHPNVVALWEQLEEGAVCAVTQPGKTIPVRGLKLQRDGTWLRIRLPSGRCLCYPGVRVDEAGKLTYMGVDQYTRTWQRIKTYGGKLCLAGGTLVLTRKGWAPIEQVTATDEVWDGVNWARTEGAICNGLRHVTIAYGAVMTPDHFVLTTEGWCLASQSERYNRAPCRLPDGTPVPRLKRSTFALGRALRMWERDSDVSDRTAKASGARDHRVMRLPAENIDCMAQSHARIERPSTVRRLAINVRSLHAAFTSGLAQLWRARHFGVRSVAALFREFLDGYAALIPARAYVGSSRQRRQLRAGELPVGDVQGPSEQSAAKVYDLVNCGPRNRFVIWAGGAPLIVHNCENVTQAASRDVIAASMPMIKRAGYEIVLTVHDEIVTEAPDTDSFNGGELAELMATNPPWSAGLPLAAKGFEGARYGKE